MDRAGLFSIGTIGKMFHLSVSSLRHYEAIGLLTPAVSPPTWDDAAGISAADM